MWKTQLSAVKIVRLKSLCAANWLLTSNRNVVEQVDESLLSALLCLTFPRSIDEAVLSFLVEVTGTF
jgi:hypothetical protein